MDYCNILQSKHRAGLFAVMSVVGVTLVGCGYDEGFYDVSGTVSFEGKPAPKGLIIFSPDRGQGNSGPQGLVRVTEGEIDDVVRPTVGGPHWLEVQVFDGVAFQEVEFTNEDGKPLMPPESIQVELPRADMELVVEITKQDDKTFKIDVKAQE